MPIEALSINTWKSIIGITAQLSPHKTLSKRITMVVWCSNNSIHPPVLHLTSITTVWLLSLLMLGRKLSSQEITSLAHGTNSSKVRSFLLPSRAQMYLLPHIMVANQDFPLPCLTISSLGLLSSLMALFVRQAQQISTANRQLAGRYISVLAAKRRGSASPLEMTV